MSCVFSAGPGPGPGVVQYSNPDHCKNLTLHYPKGYGRVMNSTAGLRLCESWGMDLPTLRSYDGDLITGHCLVHMLDGWPTSAASKANTLIEGVFIWRPKPATSQGEKVGVFYRGATQADIRNEREHHRTVCAGTWFNFLLVSVLT